MSKIIFSFGRAIPQVVKNIRDTWIYAAAGALTFSSFIAPKLNLTIDDYGTWIGISIFAVKVVAKFCGVSEDEAVANVMKSVKQVKDIAEAKAEKAEDKAEEKNAP